MGCWWEAAALGDPALGTLSAAKPRLCSAGPCRNGGTCREADGEYHCTCPYRFTGKHCEIGTAPAPTGRTGGSCLTRLTPALCPQVSRTPVHRGPARMEAPVSTTSASTSVTAPQATPAGTARSVGLRRACQYLGDDGPDCQELGACFEPLSLQLFLVPCWKGKGAGSGFILCSALLPVPSPCFLSPCENGATCEDLGGGYACTCSVGYVGKHCQFGKGLVPLLPAGDLGRLCGPPFIPCLSPEVDCGIPSEVKHAQASFNSTKVGSLAEYQCELGYILSQHNHPRVCRVPGVWSDPPECDGEECWGLGQI